MRAALLVLALPALLIACGGDHIRRSEVPLVPSSEISAEVHQQIEEARRQVVMGLGDPAIERAELARRWGELGATLHAYEIPSGARTCYREATKLAPREARWPYLRGWLERTYGDVEQSVEAFELALELEPRRAETWVALGVAYHSNGRVTDARAAFAAALEHAPNAVPALAGLARVALDLGDDDEARVLLRRALELQPAADSLHHDLARIARRRGDEAGALDHTRRAGSRQPEGVDEWLGWMSTKRLGAHNAMTEAQKAARDGDLVSAIAMYREIVKGDPGHAKAWMNLGAALARLGALEDATAALERAVELEPDDALARFNLGTVLLRQRSSRAVSELETSVTLDPTVPGARFNLAAAYRLVGRQAEAIVVLGQMVAAGEGTASVRLARASLLEHLGHHSEALAELEVGLVEYPSSLELQAAAARTLATTPEKSLRDGNRSLALARRAWDASPSLDHQRILAMALAEQGNLDAAVAEQRSVVDTARASGVAGDDLAVLEAELEAYSKRRREREG